MKRIALITPPSQFLLDERVFCSLGILKVAGALENAGYTVDHLDLSGVENYQDVIRAYSGASIFGLTATTAQMPAAIQIATLLRERPGSKLILGGPHGTLTHAAAKKGTERAVRALDLLLGYFDCIVCGDGESAIFQAIHGKGVIDADDPKSPLWLTSTGFNDSPWPARHLVDIDSYHYSVDGRRALSLIGQLGCPYKSVTADTIVFTTNGMERIDELRSRLGAGMIQRCVHGDTVVSFDFSEPVATRAGRGFASVLLDEGVRPVLELTHQCGIPLRGTAEHPVLTVLEDALVWKRMDQIKPGDWIACRFPDPVSDTPQSLTITAKLRIIPPGGFPLRPTRTPAVLNEDLAWLVGFILGDGCLPADGRPAIHVCVTAGVKEKLKRVIKDQFGVTLRVNRSSQTDNMEHGWIHSRAVYEFFVQTLQISPTNKLRVPSLIRRSPQSVIEAFLGGLWDADGYVNRTSNYLTTANAEFAREIAMLMMMVGRIPLVREINNQGFSGGTCWRVGVLMAERLPVNRSLYKSKDGAWHWRAKKSANRTGVRRRTLRESGLHHPLDIEGVFYSQVVAVTPAGSEPVYDLTVPEEENFVANGIIVHNCSFCGGRNSPSLRNIRLRQSDNVVAEMMHLNQTYGIDGLMMLDDELNVNKQVIELMRQIAATPVDWRLRGFVKANLFTEEQAEAMYAAGFRWLLCGFESAHPRILRNIQKMATIEQNTNVIRIAHKHGLKVKALMSFGHPGESEASLLATRDWLIQERPDDFDATIITVYPGTPYYDDAKLIEEPHYRYEIFGDVLYSENIDFTRESQYYKGTPGEYRSFVWTDALSRERIVELRDEVENGVRKTLGIPYPTSVAALRFESSMGQSGIPRKILRSSTEPPHGLIPPEIPVQWPLEPHG